MFLVPTLCVGTPIARRLLQCRTPLKIAFFRDCGVSSVLEFSCISLYTAVLRAVLPCTHEKIRMFRGAL